MSSTPRPFALPTYAGPAVPGPGPVSPAPLALTLSARPAVGAAHGALREAVAGLGRVQLDAAHQVQAIDRWEDAGGRRGSVDSGDRRARRRERDAWEADECSRGGVSAALGVYARALRRDGMTLPAAVVTVSSTVAAAARLAPDVRADVQRTAAPSCLEAFTAH